jgi:hypothetical protein
MIKNETGFAHYILLVLLVLVGAMGFATYNVYKNVSSEQKDYVTDNSSSDSQDSLEQYNETKDNGEKNILPQQPTAETKQKVITGNSDPSKKPEVSPTISLPVTPLESIATFVSAVKNKDFVTANSLMGTPLAKNLANYTNTTDISKALEVCTNDSACSLLLSSFQPPKSGFTSKSFVPSAGSEGTQISFLLSQSSSALAKIAGDANIDMMMENFQGVWVIQDIYVNGYSLVDYL